MKAAHDQKPRTMGVLPWEDLQLEVGFDLLYFYFTDKIDVLTGPVCFFDPGSQPGGARWFWSVQLDVDLPLRSPSK